MNSGIIHKTIRESEIEGNYFLGDSIPYEVNVESGDHTEYLPTNELQRWRYLESMACVSFSLCNVIEFQVNRMMKLGLLDTDKLEMWIYNDLFNGSDRALAKQSDTRKTGNSLANVGDTARHKGIIPEKLWSNPKYDDRFDWQDYYKEIPQAIQEWGKKFNDYFEIKYERLRDIRKEALLEQLKQSPIQISTNNHATCIYGPNEDFKQLDQYKPFLREIRENEIKSAQKIIVIPKSYILKSMENNYQVKLYKKTGDPKVYWEDQKGLLHHIDAEPFALDFFGSDYGKYIIEVPEVDGISYPIGDRSLISVIKNLFTK